ncbi:MAG: hypothetical protein ACI8ZN_001438 [Bacteroidia bacterium]|jgi:hypothetical protein
MLRNISFIGLLILSFVMNASAQNCTPDQSIKQPGFYPKTIENAVADVEYHQTLQIRVFKDTTIVIGGQTTVARIDSIKVNNIIGLPNGFYYLCNPKNCSYIPDSNGCATLNGNPTKADIGEYPLKIAITIHAKVFGTISSSQNDTLQQFTIIVTDEAGVPSYSLISTSVVYPNPSADGRFFYKSLNGEHSDLELVSCFNSVGLEVLPAKAAAYFELPTVAGIYFATFKNTTGQYFVKKIQIAH